MAGRSIGSVEVTVDASTGRLKAQLTVAGTEAGKAAKEAIDKQLADIGGPGFRRALVQLRVQAERALSGIEAEAGVDVNEHELASSRAEIEAGLAGIEAEINIDVDGAGAAGRRAGAAAGDGFLDSFTSRAALLTAAVAALAEPAVVGLFGALGAATAVTGSAFAGLSAAAAGTTGILAGLGGVLGAVKVGTVGLDDAFEAITEEFAAAAAEGRDFNLAAEEIQAALGPLAPAARDFAVAFADVLPVFDEIRREVQGRLFAGLDDVLRDLSTTAIPSVGEALEQAAEVANRFFRGLAEAAEQIDFAGVFADLTPALDLVGEALIDVFAALEPFLRAAAPAAEALAQLLADGAAALREMVEAGAESGALSDFLLDGVESLRLWLDLIGSLGEALFTVFRAGQSFGDDFIRSLDGIVQRWADWLQTDEGQAALLDFFDRARQVMSDLGPIVEGLGEAIAKLVTDESLERFGNLTDAIGKVIPAIAEGFKVVSAVLSPLVSLIADLPDGVLEAAAAVALLTVTLRTIVGPAADAVGALRNIGKAGTALSGTNLALAGIGAAAAIVAIGLDGIAEVARDVERRIDADADALREFVIAGEDAAIVANVLERTNKVSDELRDTLGGAGFDMEQFARGVIRGTESIESGFAALLETTGPVGRQLADDLESGRLAVDDFGQGLFAAAAGVGILDPRLQALAAEVEASGASFEEFAGALLVVQGRSVELNEAAAELDRQLRLQGTSLAEVERVAANLSTLLVPLVANMTSLALAEDVVSTATDATVESLAGFGAAVVGVAADVATTAAAMSDAEVAATNAARAADDFRNSLDLLLQPALDVQQTSDNLRSTFDELATQISEAQAGVEGQTLSLSALDEEGRTNRETIREIVGGIGEWAAAALEAGATNEEVTGTVNSLTDELVGQLKQFGLTEEQARQYIAQLGLTPETIDTLITNNAPEAGQLVQDYDADLGGIPDSVDTDINVNDNASGTISSIKGQLDRLDGRVVTTTMRLKHENVAAAAGALLADGIPLAAERAATGRILTGRTVLAGEQGIEAVIPLNRPLSMIDPSVRWMAAAIRAVQEGGERGQNIGKQVNVALHQNISTPLSDPALVATQVVNRMAVLAI